MSNFSKQIIIFMESDYRWYIAQSPLLADKWKR
jgi:hypothetical protein